MNERYYAQAVEAKWQAVQFRCVVERHRAQTEYLGYDGMRERDAGR